MSHSTRAATCDRCRAADTDLRGAYFPELGLYLCAHCRQHPAVCVSCGTTDTEVELADFPTLGGLLCLYCQPCPRCGRLGTGCTDDEALGNCHPT